MSLVPTTVGQLVVGDWLMLPESPRRDPIPVEITQLQPLPRSGRIRVWVLSTHQQRTMFTPWNYGAFDPSHTIERIDGAD